MRTAVNVCCVCGESLHEVRHSWLIKGQYLDFCNKSKCVSAFNEAKILLPTPFPDVNEAILKRLGINQK
jgi:hypothetical protein